MTGRFSFRFLVLRLLSAAAVSAATASCFAEETAPDDAAAPTAEKAPAEDGKAYELRYKLKHGEVLRYGVSHKASIRSTIEEQTQAAQTRTESLKAWKVIDVLPNGDIEFATVVERVHMINQLPDKDPLEYDSTKDKTPPPGFEQAASSIGVPLSIIRMTPSGKIVKRDLKIRDQTAEDDTPVALRLPEKPVAVGDTWDEPFDLQVTLEGGGTKAIQTRRHHKLANVENGIATIEVSYQVLSPIDAHIECQLVQRLMQGEVRFDLEKGRITSQQMDVDKRILGFAGPTSSMQYIMRMEEKLAASQPTQGQKAFDKPVTKATPKQKPPIRSARRTTNSSKSRSNGGSSMRR